MSNTFPVINAAAGSFLYGNQVEAAAYSICIPTYSRPYFLRQAVASAVSQHFDGKWEIIICENSTDEATLAVAREFDPRKVRLWRNQSNLGMVGNWNQCIALASAPWVTILHDDDLLSPRFLLCCDKHLQTHTAPLALFGYSELGDKPPTNWQSVDQANFYRLPHSEFFLTNPISFPGICMQRAAALALGGFNPEFGMSADYEFWSRLSSVGDILRSDRPLSFYRISAQQGSAVASNRMASDFRRVQDRLLRSARCSTLRRHALTILSELVVKNYYRRTYGTRPHLWARIFARFAACLRNIAARGLKK